MTPKRRLSKDIFSFTPCIPLNSSLDTRIGINPYAGTPNLLKTLEMNPRGKVIAYKMTDGGGIGIVLKLGDGTKNWFFENEIRRN